MLLFDTIGSRHVHREKGVCGVVLVGAIPMRHFFMQDTANPNPLYYEDYDLTLTSGERNNEYTSAWRVGAATRPDDRPA